MRESGLLCRWVGVAALSGAALVPNATGCGGSDNSAIVGPNDSGSEGSASSSSGGSGSSGGSDGSDATMRIDSAMGGDSPSDSSTTPDAFDGAATDSTTGADGSDGGASCTSANTPCDNSGRAGLCKAGSCLACTDTTDDTNCTTAYGNPQLCLAGVCTPGDCRTNSDCGSNANGSLCGASTPNFCGKCTSDQQCAGNTGTTICDVSTGGCVAGTCSIDAGVLGGPPGACPVNGQDICCAATCQPGAGANACCPGLSGDSYCAGKLDSGQATCKNNVCTTCPLVSGNYAVDPNNGSDSTGSGDGSTPGCAFKTITRALQVIGRTPAVATTITVLGASTVGVGETFPLVLPTNVTVTTSGGAVTVSVPSGKAGFVLSAIGSGINGGSGAALTISGQNGNANTATYGIVINTGTGVLTTNGPKVSNVTVTNFLDDGILVENSGIVRIGAGVTSTLNGVTTARKAGLHVTGNGQAIVNVASGAAATHFDANTNHGILVDGMGSVTVTGTVTNAATGQGTVTTNGNYAAGVSIEQTPGTPPLNAISGLVAFGNTNGNGMRFVAGSNVSLRNSGSLGNQGNGVIVSAVTATAGSNDISKIDLGSPPDAGVTYGGNTLQAALGSGNNGGAGICLQVRPNAGTLNAAGNQFATVNCGTTAGTLTLNSGACGNAACTGGVCDLGIVNTTGNGFDVSLCSP